MPSHSRRKDKKGDFVVIYADSILNFVTHPEQTIHFFELAELAFSNDLPVRYDLSNTHEISADAIAMLLSQLKNEEVNQGLFFRVIASEDILKRLNQEWKYLKKIDSESPMIEDFESGSVTKLTGTNVANFLARDICMEISKCIYGKPKITRDLYEILIELMANTQDHANGPEGSGSETSWWLFLYPSEGDIDLIFIDNGVGLFESLPVKQHMHKRNYISEFIPGADELSKTVRRRELLQVYKDLVNGNIKSSTGLAERGKGMPLVRGNAQVGVISQLTVISNDAYIDMLCDKVSVMDFSFSGTMYIAKIMERSS